MATHSSVLAWRIPGTGEPGGLPSMGSHRVGHDLAAAAAAGEGELIQNPAVTAGGTPRLCASLARVHGQCPGFWDHGFFWVSLHISARVNKS